MKNLTLVVIACIALFGGVWFANGLMVPKEPEHARLYPKPRSIGEVNLVDQNGESVTAEWFEGKWTLTFVGYTFCPDICPTTLGELKAIYPQLQAIDSEYPIEIMFMSVDPQRDTVARLKQYIDFFNPEFHAVTGEHKALFPVVRAMGMMYSFPDSTETEDYLVDHSASVVIINPRGEVVGRFMPQRKPGQVSISEGAQIVADMPTLVASFKG
ncbi:SCO family protein [Alteromonas sp. a30]|uniref:SCO family protein n=1 Tax=Alteromonas sp. a30 TaxID=2730917 RepID=UPI002280245E|nr:SCO family protein [Alteromonas sp. a30]MCY7295724.1 SCO family protein [Alteromonas sp. a30]